MYRPPVYRTAPRPDNLIARQVPRFFFKGLVDVTGTGTANRRTIEIGARGAFNTFTPALRGVPGQPILTPAYTTPLSPVL